MKTQLVIRGKFVDSKDIERFWQRVNICSEEDCWEWQAGVNSKKPGFDYGIFWINGGNSLCHRLALSFHLNKEILAEEIMHKCDNPRCCNPFHLCEGTHLENMRDMNRKNRRQCEKGIERYNAKLNDDKVREIRFLHKMHEQYKKYNKRFLSEMYGVDGNVIRGIVNGTGWKHVKDKEELKNE